MSEALKEAVLWDSLEGSKVRCNLCRHRCRIDDGKLGACRVRMNQGGVLYSLNYHKICSASVDPIEKKPLFHYQPGRKSLSIATVGCNFQCDFCQNWQISQYLRGHDQLPGQDYSAEQIVAEALRQDCGSISYTYTEPTIFMELAADCGRLAREKGLGNVFVSNGYMTPEAIELAGQFLDAINVDLKSFREDFYKDVCKGDLAGVLDTLEIIARQTNIWLEVTTLLVPGLNDSDEELADIAGFIARKLGEQVPWHISRFHPNYQHMEGSITSQERLSKAYELGKDAGLRYVYMGNVPGSQYESTFCHDCGGLLIERYGYRLGQYKLLNGKCPDCGSEMAGADLRPVE